VTDKQLRDALIEAQDYMLSQFPKIEWHYDFSPKFHKKMKELIEMNRHPIWFRLRRVVAVLFAVLGISWALLFGFNERVRADVIRWLTEQLTANEYKYQNESGSNFDISMYTIVDEVPEGYQLLKRSEDENHVSEVFRDANGKQLIFYVMSSTKENEFYLMFDKNLKSEQININGVIADLYLSENYDDNNIIVWQGTNDVLFSIAGFMNREELIELAEKIELKP